TDCHETPHVIDAGTPEARDPCRTYVCRRQLGLDGSYHVDVKPRNYRFLPRNSSYASRLKSGAPRILRHASSGVVFTGSRSGDRPSRRGAPRSPASTSASGDARSVARRAHRLPHVVATLGADCRVLVRDRRRCRRAQRQGPAPSSLRMVRSVFSIVAVTSRLTVSPPSSSVAQTKAPAATGAGIKAAPGAVVNINTASAAELDALPGIGARTAALIIEYRQKNGRG